MLRRDPLAVLQRLRGLEVAEAERLLAARRVGAAEADRRSDEASDAIAQELRAASVTEGVLILHAMADLASWLPRGESLRQRAETEARLAEAAAERAREALVAGRAAERAVEILRERRAAEMARKAARRCQAMLDEAAARQARR